MFRRNFGSRPSQYSSHVSGSSTSEVRSHICRQGRKPAAVMARPGAAEVAAIGVNPTQIENVPVARRAADVLQAGGQCRGWIRSDRAIERGPVVQGIRENADAADVRRLRPHDQRQNAHGPLSDR